MRLLLALLATLSLTSVSAALAQSSHDAGHPFYRDWVNQKGAGCCNNQDCGEIADADVKEDGDHVEVRIEGQWCEVQPWMRLRSGNAPDWSVNHACVIHDSPTLADRRPCARLICFQPKPGT